MPFPPKPLRLIPLDIKGTFTTGPPYVKFDILLWVGMEGGNVPAFLAWLPSSLLPSRVPVQQTPGFRCVTGEDVVKILKTSWKGCGISSWQSLYMWCDNNSRILQPVFSSDRKFLSYFNSVSDIENLKSTLRL
jgi:hypothetical protein